MKNYTSKAGEDLGSIAKKFGIPSWKYLYRLNQEKIGDNPDLLKEGTVLQIPQWDSTGADEKFIEKGVDPFKYTGGLRYKYPWVPLSFSLLDSERKAKQFQKDEHYRVLDANTGSLLKEGTLSKADEFEALIPDSSNISVEIGNYIIAKDPGNNRKSTTPVEVDHIDISHTLENGEAAEFAEYQVLDEQKKVISSGTLDRWGHGQVILPKGQKYEITFS